MSALVPPAAAVTLPAAFSVSDVEAVLELHPGAQTWLQTQRGQSLVGRIALGRAYAACARTLSTAVVVSDACVQPNDTTQVGRGQPHWTWLDWGRLWLTLRALHSEPAATQAKLLRSLYEHGELGEQESLLRTLGYLPEAERFAALGVEACRTNATRVFEALVLDNPFPAAVFEPLAFNQMVIKAVFMEVPLAGIVGLTARREPELVRMAEALASERRAAGREVPADLLQLIQSATPKGDST
jgi:hypothetical protein